MSETVELRSDGLHHFRMAMASVADGDAGAEIDITLALHVPDFRAFSARHEHGGNIAFAARHRRVLARLPIGVGVCEIEAGVAR